MKICEQMFRQLVLAKQAHITSEQGTCKKNCCLMSECNVGKTNTLFRDIQNYHNEPDDPSETDRHLMQIKKEAA